MAAKGAMAKEDVMKKILETFPGAFRYEKEIRIPMEENGEPLQIKVTLTAAKTMVDAGGDTALPGATKTVATKSAGATIFPTNTPMEPTEEEKKNVSNLLNMLGL